MKILDAPNIQEDFYLNLLDWSTSGSLAVALHETVYQWNSISGAIEKLCWLDSSSGDHVTSVRWPGDGRYVAVGTNRASVQLWDAARCQRVRAWTAHSGRVGSLCWKDWTLSSGSRDSKIIHADF